MQIHSSQFTLAKKGGEFSFKTHVECALSMSSKLVAKRSTVYLPLETHKLHRALNNFPLSRNITAIKSLDICMYHTGNAHEDVGVPEKTHALPPSRICHAQGSSTRATGACTVDGSEIASHRYTPPGYSLVNLWMSSSSGETNQMMSFSQKTVCDCGLMNWLPPRSMAMIMAW